MLNNFLHLVSFWSRSWELFSRYNLLYCTIIWRFESGANNNIHIVSKISLIFSESLLHDLWEILKRILQNFQKLNTIHVFKFFSEFWSRSLDYFEYMFSHYYTQSDMLEYVQWNLWLSLTLRYEKSDSVVRYHIFMWAGFVTKYHIVRWAGFVFRYHIFRRTKCM